MEKNKFRSAIKIEKLEKTEKRYYEEMQKPQNTKKKKKHNTKRKQKQNTKILSRIAFSTFTLIMGCLKLDTSHKWILIVGLSETSTKYVFNER